MNGLLNLFNSKEECIRAVPCHLIFFIFTAEVLWCIIKKNNEIKGITIDRVTHKICQYADDTILFMLFDQYSIDSSFLDFEQFQSVSGLKINYDKP